jgi:uncharacterized protein (TIGR03000 family)
LVPLIRTVSIESAPNLPAGTVQLSIKVPSAAKVFVNGHLTDSSGKERFFFASDLRVGYDYDFQIRVEIRPAGRLFSAARIVRVRAGQTHQLVFTLPAGYEGLDLDQIARN